MCPNFVPTIVSQRVPTSPAASHPQEPVTPMSSEIGTQGDTSGRSEILLTSLIMLRSLVRFQLAPPAPDAFHPTWAILSTADEEARVAPAPCRPRLLATARQCGQQCVSGHLFEC